MLQPASIVPPQLELTHPPDRRASVTTGFADRPLEGDAKPVEPLSVRISTAVKLTGISRSRIYELIQSGDLETVKIGRSTVIPYRSLKQLVRG